MRSVISRVRRALAPRLSAPPPGFDAGFYQSIYPDVRDFTAEQAASHFVVSGAYEGRSPNFAAWLAGRELPTGFDVRTYARFNEDLADFSDAQLVHHFLEHGKAEGRRYRAFNPELYREQYGRYDLTNAAAWDHFVSRHDEARIGCGADLARRNGWPGGAWIDEIRLSEFRLLNWRWAGEVATIELAARAMVEAGIDRLAPLSFAQAFDPRFYAELHPALEGASDTALYRAWLYEGCEESEAANGGEFLHRLGLDLRDYPAAFDWRAYLAKRPQAGATRWSALHYLIARDASLDPPPCAGEGAVVFLEALGLKLRWRAPLRAMAMLRAAQRHGEPSGEALEALGDICFRLRRWEEALGAFQAAALRPGAGVIAVCDGARSAIALERIDEAFDLLSLGKARFASTPWWRHALEEAVEAEFAQARSAARKLCAAGERSEAEATIVEAVRRCRERWDGFDPIGARIPSAHDGRVVILADIGLEQCRHYRVQQKAEMLEALGREHEVFSLDEVEGFISALPGAAYAIIYRAPALPRIVRALDYAQRLGVKTFYDIDDLIFDSRYFPEPFETYGGDIPVAEHQNLQVDVPLHRCAMAMCDEGLSSTAALAEHMRAVVRSGVVHVLPNGVDSLNADFLDAPPARVRRDGSVLIFYGSGTRAHNSDFVELAARALRTVLQEYPEVRLILAGHVQTEGLFDDVAERVTRVVWTSDLQAYWSLLAEVDINIAVLARTPTTDAKSEIKWLEAAVLGVPSIVSDTATYQEVLDPGVDALIAGSPQEWLEALRSLVGQAELRRSIGEAAREKARGAYLLEHGGERLEALLPVPPPVRGSRPRVLVVNVFFPPQTHGGATRVVRDNVDDMLAAGAAQDFDFAVATTDHEEPQPYRLRVDSYRGLPVYRFSTPQRAGMDWRPFDPECGARFEQILDSWRPDLVHFHCVQRFSASSLLACAERDIPYLVTLHDAWWIADHAFLVDEAHRLVDPTRSIAARPTHEVATGASVLRRRELAPLLAGAQRVLAVSETFADIYRRSGFPETIALENGVSAMGAIERLPSASGRVRICHVGSKSFHKGYLLLQATVMQGSYPNIELTVVEHERIGGPEYRTLWGATPVRFVGKTPQEEMHRFYAGQDVLAAPSIWPESFGLVSREAIDAGLWVIASDRGAIGESVTPGVNGWIIDVETPAALDAVLAEINADPARFGRSPPRTAAAPRTSADQAGDLLAIYREILASGQEAAEGMRAAG